MDNGADGVQRVQMGSSASDPFTTSKAITPLPPQAVDGLAVVDGQVYVDGVAVRCPAHPTGHRRCRFCGTTPKALAASGARQAKRAEDEQRRAGRLAIRERERALSSRSARQRDPAKAAESLRAAKAGVAAARAASKNGGNR
ncbi:hypothetical protein G5V59_26845 [Nocardioides sp. W3-2-3]|uniref:hypothetical protein n=1 Tax=Nocardioides convexus TaxID=2712224 RepID=UPI00241892E7|nr:hypothetical protein [Nocardioides convexus]NHA02011.1 hypothetical protein [Nocardioides convexus]